MKRSGWMLQMGGTLLAAVLVVLFNLNIVAAAAGQENPVVRIGLMTQQFGYLAACTGPYEVVDSASGKVQAELAAGS